MSVSITWRYRDLAIATVGSAVLLFWWAGQGAKDIPAWIQAVGSVLAIVAVFWISEANREKEQRSRHQSVLAVVRVAHEFAMSIDTELQAILAEKPCGFDASNIRSIYHRDISKRYGEALANVPLHELGSADAVKALLALQVQFSVFFPDAMDKLLNGPGEIGRSGNTKHQALIFQRFIQQQIPPMKPQFKHISDQWNILSKALS
jgi:hypothetical protein